MSALAALATASSVTSLWLTIAPSYFSAISLNRRSQTFSKSTISAECSGGSSFAISLISPAPRPKSPCAAASMASSTFDLLRSGPPRLRSAMAANRVHCGGLLLILQIAPLQAPNISRLIFSQEDECIWPDQLVLQCLPDFSQEIIGQQIAT